MRTVICDDDEKLCRILQIFLEEYGESRGISVDVEVFSDGEILLQQLETGKQYDLLFLDIIMKHVDGNPGGRVCPQSNGRLSYPDSLYVRQ